MVVIQSYWYQLAFIFTIKNEYWRLCSIFLGIILRKVDSLKRLNSKIITNTKSCCLLNVCWRKTVTGSSSYVSGGARAHIWIHITPFLFMTLCYHCSALLQYWNRILRCLFQSAEWWGEKEDDLAKFTEQASHS